MAVEGKERHKRQVVLEVNNAYGNGSGGSSG